jgi:Transcriptional regulatory protein, C terminal
MRLKFLSVFFIPALTILAVYVSGETAADSFEANKEMIVLRKIGHEILLNSGDSHSRVLPIRKISSQEFRVSFENAFSLMPDSVIRIVDKIAKENKLAEFSVNILDCQEKETVYGFAISSLNDGDNILPCLGRELPKDCYHISILFPARQKQGLRNLYYIAAALVIAASLYFLQRFRYKKRPAPDPGPVKEAVQLGKYFFYPEQQYLELNGEKTALTNKEARLLYILANAPNTVVERDLLQKEVWENEGVIVTRSLDMFISKLRKKLNGDTNIKIVNAHGKGYKLEIV